MSEEKDKKDTLDTEILAALKERFTSPIWGTFVLVLILFNWDVFSIYIFEEETRQAIATAITEKTPMVFFGIPVLIVLAYLALYDLLQGLVNLYRENISLKISEWSQSTKSAQTKLAIIETKYIEIARQSDEYEAIEKELLAIESQSEKRRSELDEQKRNSEELDSGLAAETQKLSEKTDELSGLKKQIESTESELETLSNEFADIESKKKSYLADLKKLESETAEYRSKIGEIYKDLASSAIDEESEPQGLKKFERIIPEYRKIVMQADRYLSESETLAKRIANLTKVMLQGYRDSSSIFGEEQILSHIGYDKHIRVFDKYPIEESFEILKGDLSNQELVATIGMHANTKENPHIMFHLVFILGVNKGDVHVTSMIYGTVKDSLDEDLLETRWLERTVPIERGVSGVFNEQSDIDLLTNDISESQKSGGLLQGNIISDQIYRYGSLLESKQVFNWLRRGYNIADLSKA